MKSSSNSGGKKPPRPRASRLTRAERREQLLACAMRVFARRGIGEARHAEIAARAKVAVPTVFVYFPSRKQLVNAVLDEIGRYYIAMLRDVEGRKADARTLLFLYTRAFADSVDSHPDYARVFLEWSVAVRDQVWPRYLRFQRRVCEILEGTIRRGQHAGEIAPEITAEDSALFIMSAAHVIAQLKFRGYTRARVERFLRALARSAVDGRLPAAD